MSKAREFISPSDLTFSWDNCHRCLWLYYNHGLKAPSFFPLVGELSALQEGHFANAISSELHPDLPEGRVLERVVGLNQFQSHSTENLLPLPFVANMTC